MQLQTEWDQNWPNSMYAFSQDFSQRQDVIHSDFLKRITIGLNSDQLPSQNQKNSVYLTIYPQVMAEKK